MKCMFCDEPIEENNKFCTKCGKRVVTNEIGNVNSSSQGEVFFNGSEKLSIIIGLVIMIGFALYLGLIPIPFQTSQVAQDAAKVSMKSRIYKDFGDIPKMESSVLYNKGDEYIVIVKYKVGEDLEFSGSCAVFVSASRDYGYVKDYITNYHEYDFDYSDILEELKTVFEIS